VTDDTTASMQGAAPADDPSAGTRLREARMAAGLSIDAVAQQLKLAPRQVVALEQDDFPQLPGRTFIRGFVRNYARLLRLDTEAVLAALPEPELAPSLDHPSLAPTPRAMGELPADLQKKSGGGRWAIALALIAIVGIGLVYEFTRPGSELARSFGIGRDASPSHSTLLPTPVVPASPTPPVASDAPPATSLANPMATSATPAGETPAPGTGVATAEPPATAAATGSTDAPLLLVFRATSWVEVKDGNGAVLLSTMGYPGATHAVGGKLPLEVVLGNAEAVNVTWHGTAFDTTPYVRQNVAKFLLK
jgi:cytoskeleton protein RodZ